LEKQGDQQTKKIKLKDRPVIVKWSKYSGNSETVSLISSEGEGSPEQERKKKEEGERPLRVGTIPTQAREEKLG